MVVNPIDEMRVLSGAGEAQAAARGLRAAEGRENARGAADRRSGAARDAKLYEACVDFESIFIKQMLSVMRKTVHKTGLLDGGAAEEIFEDMLYDQYAGSMARNAHFGLADTIYDSLTGAQRRALEAE